MNKSPAFQFYPDKWQSHTRRLSDSSYRVYHELLCWMWQHSPDHCSIEASIEAVSCAVAMPTHCVRIAIADIQNAFSPLLKEHGGRWISNGLKKEAEKQSERREKAQKSAKHRWKEQDANASKKNANASFEQCFPSPTPTPSPTPVLEREREAGAFAEIPTLEEVLAMAEMRGVLPTAAKSFFDHHQDNSLWLNQHGRLINWQSKLVNWQVRERANAPIAPKKATVKIAV